jgi:hypothetical protein
MDRHEPHWGAGAGDDSSVTSDGVALIYTKGGGGRLTVVESDQGEPEIVQAEGYTVAENRFRLGSWTARCPSLNVTASGDSRDAAVHALRDVVACFLAELRARNGGSLEDGLRSLGWHLASRGELVVRFGSNLAAARG